MQLKNIRTQTTTGYSTWGCIWDQGKCNNDTVFICKNKTGKQIPMQSRITAFWPDGSVKWTAHTAEVSQLGDEIEVSIAPSQDSTVTTKSSLTKNDNSLQIKTKTFQINITKNSNYLFDTLFSNGKLRLQKATPVLIIEKQDTTAKTRKDVNYTGQINTVSVEAEGEIETVLKFEGCHVSEVGETLFPFVIRMTIYNASHEIHFAHTFIYDGDEDTDFLKGIGIQYDTPLSGELYNRHIKISTDNGFFHESVVPLLSWRPRIPEELYQQQMQGECLYLNGENKQIVDKVLQDTPFWSEYDLCQDNATHYLIKKKLKEDNCCYIDSLHGIKTDGSVSIGCELGNISMAMRDFWEKHPSGYQIKGLDSDICTSTCWFWSPSAQPMDFRHYANRGYNQVCYEGYDFKGATPVGIACTNECIISIGTNIIASDTDLTNLASTLNKPALYVASPEFYYQKRAFGYWSLPSYDTEMELWLETQLDQAATFFKNEVAQRGWYGMFNYGDFMHTYDKQRHNWRYDIGGYAWDNTELVPTLWLWLYFMRTGREDIFTLAEKLSRHTSEVDVYHIGNFKGLGSRHNVRHWGCPCKEARIAMAGHHRFLYYLTGDRRLEDIFEELKDNEQSFYHKDPLGEFYDKKDMVYPSHARSGPDWSSLCSNWMTEWERKNDARYREKIEVGLIDIANAPLQLSSGPDFEFDPATFHLLYIGERTTGGCHLQLCMGAPQIWFELADLLQDENFKTMLAKHGRFYFLTHQEQLEESNGLIGDRESSLPFMASAMGAYGAKRLGLDWLATKTWKTLLKSLMDQKDSSGFAVSIIENCGNQKELSEIPWISTNFAAQWCLNVIMVLDFIKTHLPQTLLEAHELTKDMDSSFFRKA